MNGPYITRGSMAPVKVYPYLERPKLEKTATSGRSPERALKSLEGSLQKGSRTHED
jgi:hypothetical protein